MKVLLIQPPVQDFYDTEIRLQPLGLAYLKAVARQRYPSAQIEIYDYHAQSGRHTIQIPSELRYLREYFVCPDRAPFKTFYHYYHFGKSFENIQTEINRKDFDFVGISSLFTPYYREALEVASLIKKCKNVPVLFGGAHVSAVPEFALLHPAVDYVIRGMGERPFIEFLEYFSGERPIEDVSGLGYKSHGKIILNPLRENYPIDDIPVPDFTDFPLDRYEYYGKPMSFLLTSRGCPHSCSFCSVHQTVGHGYRKRSVTHVLQEIQLRYQQGYRVIDFEDDNLTFYKSEMKLLCRELIRNFHHREMKYVAMNGVSYLSLDDELLENMHEAGFVNLNLSLVSSDQTVLNSTKRPHSMQSYQKIVSRAHELGMKITAYQILGLPFETLESMIQTLGFQTGLPVLLGVSPFYLIPNSPIAGKSELNSQDYFKARLTAFAVETENFKRDDIYTLFVCARILNFIKGLPVNSSLNLKEFTTGDPDLAIGFELLKYLFIKKKLYFVTSNGFVLNRHFKTDIFFRVLENSDGIRCLNGHRVTWE